MSFSLELVFAGLCLANIHYGDADPVETTEVNLVDVLFANATQQSPLCKKDPPPKEDYCELQDPSDEVGHAYYHRPLLILLPEALGDDPDLTGVNHELFADDEGTAYVAIDLAGRDVFFQFGGNSDCEWRSQKSKVKLHKDDRDRGQDHPKWHKNDTDHVEWAARPKTMDCRLGKLKSSEPGKNRPVISRVRLRNGEIRAARLDKAENPYRIWYAESDCRPQDPEEFPMTLAEELHVELDGLTSDVTLCLDEAVLPIKLNTDSANVTLRFQNWDQRLRGVSGTSLLHFRWFYQLFDRSNSCPGISQCTEQVDWVVPHIQSDSIGRVGGNGAFCPPTTYP